MESDLHKTNKTKNLIEWFGLVAKSFDRHVELALKTTLEENIAMIKDTVAFLALTTATANVNWLGNKAPVNVQRSAGTPSHVVKSAHVYG